MHIVLLTAVLVLSAPGQAAQTVAKPEAKPTATQMAANEKQDRVVCRSETRVNSRFERKVCRTVSTWKTLEAKAQQDFNEVQQRRQSCVDPFHTICD